MTKGWYNTKAKVFFDQRSGEHHENEEGNSYHEKGIQGNSY
jgi:hypothetical protein